MKSEQHPTEKLGRKPKTSNKSYIRSIKTFPRNSVAYISGLGRNTKLALVLVLVLVFVGGLVSLLRTGSSNENQLASESIQETTEENKLNATLRIIEGSVESKNQERDWSNVSESDEFSEGDDIRTVGATSRAELEFENGSVIRIAPNSEILLETLNTERIVIRQTNGYTYNRVSDSLETPYIVKSTDAQYEAAGTAFRVITTGDEQAVEVYESRVVETSTNQNIESGKKLTVVSSVQPSNNGRIENIAIETIKEDEFILWNRSLDAENEKYKDKLGFLNDIEAPEIVISSPADNATILLEPNADKGTVEFKGSTEPGSNLVVVSRSSADTQPVTITVGEDGNFTSPIIEAPLGSSVFEFTATDKVGNKTTQNIRLNFQRKSAPITSGGIVLSVKEDGDKIKVNWSYSGSFKPKDGIKIVYSTDKAPTFDGNTRDSVYAEKGNSITIRESKLQEDTTYYLRACSYDKKTSTCSDYSNQVSFKTSD